MKLTARILLTACLLSNLLTATSEAGKFGSFGRNLSKRQSSSNQSSFSQKSNNFSSNRRLNSFNNSSKSNFSNNISSRNSNFSSNSRLNSFQNKSSSNLSGGANLLKNKNTFTKSRNSAVNNLFNSNSAKGQKMTILPVKRNGSAGNSNLFKGSQSAKGKTLNILPVNSNGSSRGGSPIKNLQPAKGGTPFQNGGGLTKNFPPARGSSPVIKGIAPITGKGPIKNLPPINTGKLPVSNIRNPSKGGGLFNSGDPDAGSPVKPRNPGQLQSGDGDITDPAKTTALPTTGQDIVDRAGVTDRLPIDNGRLPGNNNPPQGNQGGGTPGQWQEGDVIAGNGTVVDQEFLDIQNGFYNDGTLMGDNVLLTGQPAPWDNPDDPFWNQTRPEDWKGYWPGGPKLPPGPDFDPGQMGPPEFDPPQGGHTPPPPYCPPGQVPPYCPPGNCPPGYCPPPICLPPIVNCPPVCTPCVTSVCRQVVAVQQPVVEEVVEEAAAPVLQLVVGKPATLEANGLGSVPGGVAIEVGGIGLPATVKSWTDTLLQIDVPFMGLNGPTPATLHLFDANRRPIASIPVELITEAAATVAAE